MLLFDSDDSPGAKFQVNLEFLQYVSKILIERIGLVNEATTETDRRIHTDVLNERLKEFQRVLWVIHSAIISFHAGTITSLKEGEILKAQLVLDDILPKLQSAGINVTLSRSKDSNPQW